MLLCAAVATVLACALVAPAGTIRHDVADQEYRDLASEPAFDTVGKFVVQTTGGTFVGSGVLIDPWWVLTAAHMVDTATAVSFTVNGVSHTGETWVVHESWNSNDIAKGYDLALVRLSIPTGLTPSELYAGSSEVGMAGVSVGYGRTGTGLTGDIIASGTKCAGENMIDVATPQYGDDSGRILLTDFDSPTKASESLFGSSTPLDLEYMIAPGDSGGGLFVADQSGYKVVGICSYLSSIDGSSNSDYGDMAGYTRVSQFISWIQSVVSTTIAPILGDANLDGVVDLDDFSLMKAAFGGAGNWSDGDFNGDGSVNLDDFGALKNDFGMGADVVPEPGVLSLISAGAVLMIWRRRGRKPVR